MSISHIAVTFCIIALTMIFYAYAGYPLLLLLLARSWPTEKVVESPLPLVAIILSVYNEEKVIGERLDNIMQLEYPKDKLEIVVVSDGSTDRTEEIVRSKALANLQLMVQKPRQGKSAALNQAVAACTADIIVFTDANSFFDSDALRYLTTPFEYPEIGFVTGRTLYHLTPKGSVGVGIYSQLEHFVKERETQLGSCVGADGAIFAMRRELYEKLHPERCDDLVSSLNVVLAGYRGVFEPRAFCRESTAENMQKEFQRQVRISNRTMTVMIEYLPLFLRSRKWKYSFLLISHKALRLAVPFAMLILFMACILGNEISLLKCILYLQVFFYCLALTGFLVQRFRRFRLIGLPFDFATANLAILAGWLRYFRGERDVLWEPVRDI
jgi:cellulose synthase/poly-beta-1,6-N-acetylglucosamine synthase-like glycosyltransferase